MEYKIWHKYVYVECNKGFMFDNIKKTRGNDYEIAKQNVKLDSRNSFT